MNPQKDEDLQVYIATHQEALQEIAKEMVAKRIVFTVHFWLWVFTNLLLLLIFALTEVSMDTMFWTAVPWGFVVLLHGFNLVVFRNGWLGNYNEYAYAYHLFLFVTVTILLLFIDLNTPEIGVLDWFFWALMGMGIALFLHTVIFFILRRKSNHLN